MMEHLRLKFLKECDANLDLINRSLQAAAQAGSADAFGELFRGVHSIKGGAGFFDLDRLVWLATAMEDVCSQLLSGTRALTSELLATLNHAVQVLTDLVEAAEIGIDLVAGYELATGQKLVAA
jgi:two-component system, chemotaxis family, sensor kinase CheA